MTRGRRTAVIVAVIALLQGAAVLAWLRRDDDAGRVSVRAPVYERARTAVVAPELVASSARGEVSSSSLRGRPALLHFWATWCAPCHEELPELLALARELDLPLLAVSVDESDVVLQHYFQGSPPPEVARVDHEVARRLFDATTLPVTLLVDERGVVRGRFRGAQSWRTAEMRVLLTEELRR